MGSEEVSSERLAVSSKRLAVSSKRKSLPANYTKKRELKRSKYFPFVSIRVIRGQNKISYLITAPPVATSRRETRFLASFIDFSF
jgi:hypothetical protein